MSSQALTTTQITAEAIEKVLLRGDLSSLSTTERLSYYRAVCESVGLNPLTRPLEYLNLSGKLTLYARKDATDQLRKIHSVSIDDVRTERFDDVFVVTAKAKDKEGRQDSATGAVTIGNLKGDALANAIMKAETKAKRRVTLSICGLGLLDETELETIKDVRPLEQTVEITGALLEQKVDLQRYWWKIQNGHLCAVYYFADDVNKNTQLCDYSRLIDQEGKQVTLKVYDRGERDGKRLYELADVVKVEPVPNPTTTTQGASPSVPVVEPVPQKIDPMCNIDETLLVCLVSDVTDELAAKPRYKMVHYGDKQIASCWDHKLWPDLEMHKLAGTECVFKVENKKAGPKRYTNIKGIISIDGVPYKQAVSA